MVVWFGGQPSAPPHSKPNDDADFIAFYLGTPDSAITHIGVVRNIIRSETLSEADEYRLSAIYKLDPPVIWAHPVRNFEYTTLDRLGIKKLVMIVELVHKMS